MTFSWQTCSSWLRVLTKFLNEEGDLRVKLSRSQPHSFPEVLPGDPGARSYSLRSSKTSCRCYSPPGSSSPNGETDSPGSRDFLPVLHEGDYLRSLPVPYQLFTTQPRSSRTPRIAPVHLRRRHGS